VRAIHTTLSTSTTIRSFEAFSTSACTVNYCIAGLHPLVDKRQYDRPHLFIDDSSYCTLSLSFSALSPYSQSPDTCVLCQWVRPVWNSQLLTNGLPCCLTGDHWRVKIFLSNNVFGLNCRLHLVEATKQVIFWGLTVIVLWSTDNY